MLQGRLTVHKTSPCNTGLDFVKTEHTQKSLHALQLSYKMDYNTRSKGCNENLLYNGRNPLNSVRKPNIMLTKDIIAMVCACDMLHVNIWPLHIALLVKWFCSTFKLAGALTHP